MAGSCKRGIETSGSVKSGGFLDYLRTCKLLKKDSAPWSKYEGESYENLECFLSRNLLNTKGTK